MKSRLTGLISSITLTCLLLVHTPGSIEAAPQGRKVLVEATAYSSQDPGLSSTTALGTPLRRGVIAVDPDFIPLGSHVYIPGYGEAYAEDVGGAIVGDIIDIAFDTHDEALEFGRQEIYIYLLDEEETDDAEDNTEEENTDEADENDLEDEAAEINEDDDEEDDGNDNAEEDEQEDDDEEEDEE